MYIIILYLYIYKEAAFPLCSKQIFFLDFFSKSFFLDFYMITTTSSSTFKKLNSGCTQLVRLENKQSLDYARLNKKR